MSETRPTAAPPKRSKLLIASLAANMLVIGLIGGAFAVRHRFGPPGEFNIGRMLGDPGLRGFVRTLPKERHVILRNSAESVRLSLRPLRQAALQAKTTATLAINIEPFDATRVEKAMTDWIAAETDARRAGVAMLLQTMAKMTPDERSQFQTWRKQHDHMPPYLPAVQGEGVSSPQPSDKPQR